MNNYYKILSNTQEQMCEFILKKNFNMCIFCKLFTWCKLKGNKNKYKNCSERAMGWLTEFINPNKPVFCRDCGKILPNVRYDNSDDFICRECAIKENIEYAEFRNIYCVEGDKVKVTENSIKFGWPWEENFIRQRINIDDEYTVNSIEINGYASKISLKEFKNLSFNLNQFIYIPPEFIEEKINNFEEEK